MKKLSMTCNDVQVSPHQDSWKATQGVNLIVAADEREIQVFMHRQTANEEQSDDVEGDRSK